MKYIFITFNGLGLPIAHKLVTEGCDVQVGIIDDIKDYVMEEESSSAKEDPMAKQRRLQLYQGVVPFTDATKLVERMQSMRNPEEYFVFFEENNLYRWADKIKDLGFHGNFPTKDDYLFEIDRDRAKEFVKKHYPKLYVPEVKEFEKAAEGKKFLDKTDNIWVLKSKHEEGETFVPTVEDPELAARQISEKLENGREGYERMGYILELYIPAIIELTPEKIYYDGVPLATSIDIENKNFGAANISVQTGCAGDLVFPTDMDERINQLAFPPVVDEMAKAHKGLFIWDASILVNKRDGKMYFGEFCSNRPGYNAFFTELAQASSVNDFFEKIIKKQSPFTLGTVASSLRLFNLNTDESEHVAPNIAIEYKSESEKDIWMWDVRKNRKGKLVSVGADWNLAVITGSGKSINEAVSRMYKNVDAFAFVGVYYRSKDDFLSHDYPTSIINRLNYGMERGLYKIPFDVRVGEIPV